MARLSSAQRRRFEELFALHNSEAESSASPTHRDVRGGGFRAAIFGVSDGLVSNISLVLGTAGAHPGAGVVRLAGLAGLLGGSFSMAAGEYVSMRGQQEALERELAVERDELDQHPVAERNELEAIYRRRGVSPEVARQVVEQLMASPDAALVAHARDELGIDPGALGSPIQASISSFFTFALGALVPLVPFLGGTSGTAAIVTAIILTATFAIAVGGTLAIFTGRPKVFSALRSLAICAVAGAITYGVGSLIGVAAH